MKIQRWIVTLVAVLAGSAGAAAPAGEAVTVTFPALGIRDCPFVLQSGELSVSNESGKLAFAFKGTVTMKTSCTAHSEFIGSASGPVPGALAITNLTIVVDAAAADGPSVVSMTADKIEAAPE